MNKLSISKAKYDDVWQANSATTYTILQEKEYCFDLKIFKAKVNTILGSTDLIEGFGQAIILLASGTKLCIYNALYSNRCNRNLLSFKDIHQNGYHIGALNKNNIEYLYITSDASSKICILVKLPILSSRLYYTIIDAIKSYVVMN